MTDHCDVNSIYKQLHFYINYYLFLILTIQIQYFALVIYIIGALLTYITGWFQ